MDEQRDTMPDPGQAADLAEFVCLLGELRAWAGMPSYRLLAKRVGPLMRPARVVSLSTVVDAFKTGRSRLDLDLIVGIVRALGADEPAVDRWREACIKVHGLAKTGGPVGVFGQLPTDLATFTGRREELARLIADATQHHNGDGTNTVVISAVEGMAGVGKTQLAIHAAHELVRGGHFTDTQLHVNLRGFDPELPPADPSTVLEAFLRQLGVPAQQIPASLDERAAMYRDRLRERSALVLLDNAANENQVRDLIPSGPTCLVLITSRRSLAGLDGVTPHLIDTFTETESLDLLMRIAGRDRVEAEPEAAAKIVQFCDHLPLALALAAARLRSRPAWSLQQLADRLRDGQLDGIRAGGRALRPVLDLSYRALPDQAQRMFRLLGLHTGPDFTAEAAAALAESTLAETSATLEMLLDEHLLQQKRSGRYELHDLLRACALERAAEDGDAARDAARARVIAWYTHSACNAMTALKKPGEPPTMPCHGEPAKFSSHDAALSWLAAEETNLDQAMLIASETELHELAWRMGRHLYDYHFERGRITDSIRVIQRARESAKKAGDHSAEIRAASNLGWAYAELADFAKAESYFRESMDVCRETGDRPGESWGLSGLGKVFGDQGRYTDALNCHQAALDIDQQAGDRRSVGVSLNNIGTIYFQMQHYDRALASYNQALEIFEALEADSFTLVLLLGNIAEAHLHKGEYDTALRYETRRLTLTRAYGHHLQEAMSLLATGDVLSALGRGTEARTAWTRSLSLYAQLDHPDATEVRQRLGTSHSGRAERSGA
ncbi:ATP-binding protein [Streptomyces sp. NRAIS4]